MSSRIRVVEGRKIGKSHGYIVDEFNPRTNRHSSLLTMFLEFQKNLVATVVSHKIDIDNFTIFSVVYRSQVYIKRIGEFL